MIAHITDLKPGEFIHTLGDAHVYKNHKDVLQQQVGKKEKSFIVHIYFELFLKITRHPFPFPTLKIQRKVQNINDFVFDDFVIEGYESHPPIKMKMAV